MNFKRKQKLFFLFTTLLFIAFTKYSNAATFYVPDNYSTIQSAVNAVSSGDTVYVRAGNYNEQFSISSSNITVAGIEGSRPRIYAGSMTGGEYLVTISGSNIRFRNFEIENTPVESAPQRALGVTGNDNLIENIKVHHSWKSGILITGDRNLLENNEVYLNSMRTDGRTSGTYSVTAQGEDNIIRNSLVYENDGEAISCFKGRRTIIENNISYNNRVNIYIDNCPGAIVRNNLAYQSEAGTGHASISVCDESYSTEREASDGLRIYNNFSMGGNGSLNIQGGSCWIGLTNATIAHNTFVNDSSDETFYLSGSSKDIVNTYVVNNIFVNTSSSRIASIGVSDPDLHFHHNLWSVAPSNSNARGEGDVIGDPLLAKIGPTSAGALTADWFRLLSNSPAIDHNNHVSGIYNDYFYNLRDSLPDYGGHEYNGTGGSTPTPYNTPTPRPSPTSTPIPSPTPPLSPNTVLRRVCSSSDDAEESVSGGSVTLSSSDLELTQENDNQIVGIRFQDIDIPRGAVIENAYIEFECDEASSVSTSLTLRGESSDNALSFGSSSYNISSRADTSSSVNWNSLPSWSVDQKYQTPNLSSIVQEIVNRGGWNSGNSLSFTITGSGTRVAESYDGESQNAPLLYVKYSPTGTACVRSNGDANGDGRAALYDYAVWANYFAPFVRNYGGPTVGDFNCDNYVDLTDYAIWANYFTPI